MKKDKNIFETAAKKLGPRGKKSEQAPKSKRKGPLLKESQRDPEVGEMMRQIREMNEDLRRQMETISKKSGLSYDKVKELVGNPKFLPPELQALSQNQEEEYKALSYKVWGVVGVPNKPAVKQRENIQGERRAKTLGSRKKWIPIK